VKWFSSSLGRLARPFEARGVDLKEPTKVARAMKHAGYTMSEGWEDFQQAGDDAGWDRNAVAKVVSITGKI